MRRNLGAILKLIVSLALIVFIFARVDRSEVGRALASVQIGLALLALTLYQIAIAINAWKWAVLLRAQNVEVPFRSVLDYTYVGFFFNNLLPNIGGDVMRGWGLARTIDRTSAAAASVVIDRLIGLLAYMISAVICAAAVVFGTGRADLRVLLGLAALAVLGLAGLLAVLISRRLRGLFERLFELGFLRPLAPRWRNLSGAFDAYRFEYRTLALAFGIGLLGVIATALVNYVFVLSLGGGISLLHVLLFNPLIALAQIVPISIGGLGVNQAIYPFFFGLVGAPETLAVTLSLLMQATSLLSGLPGAVLWLRWRQRMPTPDPLPPAGHA